MIEDRHSFIGVSLLNIERIMEMESELIKEKMLKIAELCLDISSREKNTLFFNYSGHVETLSLDYFKSGWKPMTCGDVQFRIPIGADYLTQDEKLEKLNEIIVFLKKI